MTKRRGHARGSGDDAEDAHAHEAHNANAHDGHRTAVTHDGARDDGEHAKRCRSAATGSTMSHWASGRAATRERVTPACHPW